MSLGSGFIASNLSTSLRGTLQSWYEDVDGALRASEVVAGQYEYMKNIAYGTESPDEGGDCFVDIGCERFHCISLDNSYINVQQRIPITVPKQPADLAEKPFPRIYYVGYKSAVDVLNQYRLYSDGDLIQTNNHPNYENFVIYNSLHDNCKVTNDAYATWEKIQRMDPDVPGTYIDVSKITTGATEIIVTLKFRIPINQFMILSNLRWWPAFFGKLSFQLYPSYLNAVICPVFPKHVLDDMVPSSTARGVYNDPGYQFGFVQLNNNAANLITFTKDGQGVISHTVGVQSFKASTSKMERIHIHLAYYMVRMDIYNVLEAKYLQVPLLFPIQETQIKQFTKPIGNQTNFTVATSLGLKHCDGMYIVFPEDHNSRTCFHNPEISFNVTIDGKLYPRENYDTVDDPRFTNMVRDALNINNNTLVSLGKDCAGSMQPCTYCTQYGANGTVDTSTPERCYISPERSNFMIGIPFCNDEDFMGGISSQGSIQVELSGSRIAKNAIVSAKNWTTSPTAIFFEDSFLKLRSLKPPGQPQVMITKATIEQILAGAM